MNRYLAIRMSGRAFLWRIYSYFWNVYIEIILSIYLQNRICNVSGRVRFQGPGEHWPWSKRMENSPLSDVSAQKLKGIPANQWSSMDCPVDDCRNLVRLLASKTEILYRECRFDKDKARHIRTMASTLAALSVLVNRLDRGSPDAHAPDVLKDAQGFTYQTVRSCDLDRLCDK